MEHDDLTNRLGRAPIEPTLDDAGNVDTCSYCRFPFDETDHTVLTFADATTKELARCPQCSAVHVRIITNSGWLEHAAGCPGLEIARTESHPTEDNTPWGHPSCRHCTMPDPFTHLVGFVAGVTANAQKSRGQIDALQAHNSTLVIRERETLRINHLVHEQMARMHNVVTHERLANILAADVSTSSRVSADLYIGKACYTTVGAIVRAAFLHGVSAVLALKDTVDDGHAFLSLSDLSAVRRLLTYSWNDIDDTYESLTDVERSILDADTFARLVAWLRVAQ